MKHRGARLAEREARHMHVVEQLGNGGRPAEQVRLAHITCKISDERMEPPVDTIAESPVAQPVASAQRPKHG